MEVRGDPNIIKKNRNIVPADPHPPDSPETKINLSGDTELEERLNKISSILKNYLDILHPEINVPETYTWHDLAKSLSNRIPPPYLSKWKRPGL